MEERKLLDAWTASNGNPRPLFVCINQVDSMCEIILRDEQKDPLVPNSEICLIVNNWTLGKLGYILREAASKFQTGAVK